MVSWSAVTITLEKTINVAIGVAALSIAAVLAHREFAPTPKISVLTRASVEVRNWREALPIGVRYGNADAPVTIVVFSDFECPFCARFNAVADSALQRRKDVALAFVHFPLASHRFAVPAARAAECADRYGRFGGLADLLFAKQDSLGI